MSVFCYVGESPTLCEYKFYAHRVSGGRVGDRPPLTQEGGRYLQPTSKYDTVNFWELETLFSWLKYAKISGFNYLI